MLIQAVNGAASWLAVALVVDRGAHVSELDEPIDRTGERDGVDVPGGVLAERRQASDRQARRLVLASVARAQEDGVDLRAAVVAEQVAAGEFAQRGVTDDVAADDRAISVAVARDDRGPDRSRRRAGIVAAVALEDAPPVVGADAVAAAGEVDFLLRVLADVSDDRDYPCGGRTRTATDCGDPRPRSRDDVRFRA